MNQANQIRKELRIIVRELGLLNHNTFNSGMTLVQAHILNYLLQNNTTPFNELLLQLGCDKASFSRTVKGLETKGYIKTEKMENDKRMKSVSLTEFGRKTISSAEVQAEKYIENILNVDCGEVSGIIDALASFRVLISKKAIMENDSKLIFEELNPNYNEIVMNLLVDIFTGEQDIPEKLIPIAPELKPTWWTMRLGEDIVGVSACWYEKDTCHLGRLAIDNRFRGLGLGKKLIISTIEAIFKRDVDRIYMEARDITLNIVQKIGGQIIGETEIFYGGKVTPVVLKKSDFIKIKNSK
jgi:DNA-binding MarR family transcriptional regulator